MNAHSHWRMRLVSSCTVGLVIGSLLSCSYTAPIGDICSTFESLPLAQLESQSTDVVLEDPGTIKVLHGTGCAKRNSGEYLKIEQSVDLPRDANRATVFLNGWKLNYAGTDHHVRALETAIGKIRMENNRLIWNAVGFLTDNGQDEPFDWCYYFTVIAWNNASLNAEVDHDDAGDFCSGDTGTTDNFYLARNDDASTSLSAFRSFLQNDNLAAGGTIAILPRGFGFLFGDDDHHLFQLAYNLDHSDAFIEHKGAYRKADGVIRPELPNAANRAGSGFVSWNTYAILKDNTRRDYRFGEMVSGIGGRDVEVIQPPFSILPRDTSSATAVGDGSALNQEFAVENVPFDYAIPMLTGWELSIGNDDEEVKEIGVWIDNLRYEKNPAATTGTLRYKLSSLMKDRDGSPGSRVRHKVTILGLRGTAGVTGGSETPDLVAVSPNGTAPSAFCRVEDGRKLRVTIKNQGSRDAPASKTTVTFGRPSVSVDTPPIPKGGSGDVLINVPPNCFSPDCSFEIMVDSGGQVDERSSEGNNRITGFCIG